MLTKQLDNGSEYADMPEEIVCPEEITCPDEMVSCPEFAALPEEYPESGNTGRKAKSAAKKERSNSRLVRKMGYLVASTVAVVTIGNTLDPEVPGRPAWVYPGMSSEETKEEADGKVSGGNQGTDVSGTVTDYIDGTVTGPKQGQLAGVLTLLPNGGSVRAGGGFVHDVYDEKLYNYQGEVLDPGFGVTYINEIYDSGYARVQKTDDLSMYLMDAQGEVVMNIEELTDFEVQEKLPDYMKYYGEVIDIEGDIICEAVHVELSSTVGLRLRNIKTGEVIKELSVDSQYGLVGANDFGDGVMPIFLYEDNEYSYTWGLLYTDGSFRVLKEANMWEYHGDTTGQMTKYVPHLGGIADGCMVIIQHLMQGEGASDDRYTFLDMETGETLREYMKGDFQKEYGENASISDSLRNYGLISSNGGDILFDFADMDEKGMLSKRIASYDKIFLKDSPYLLVSEGNAYYYIDWKGNVVGGPYARATQFSKDGYAAVQKEEYTYEVTILSDQMEEVERIYGAGLAINAYLDAESILDVFPLWFNGEYRYTDVNGNEPMNGIEDMDFGNKHFIYYYDPS